MAEMRTLNCPACEAPNQPVTVAEGVEEYRCRACGLVYVGPFGCDTMDEVGDDKQSAEPDIPEDFEMRLPPPRG